MKSSAEPSTANNNNNNILLLDQLLEISDALNSNNNNGSFFQNPPNKKNSKQNPSSSSLSQQQQQQRISRVVGGGKAQGPQDPRLLSKRGVNNVHDQNPPLFLKNNQQKPVKNGISLKPIESSMRIEHQNRLNDSPTPSAVSLSLSPPSPRRTFWGPTCPSTSFSLASRISIQKESDVEVTKGENKKTNIVASEGTGKESGSNHPPKLQTATSVTDASESGERNSLDTLSAPFEAVLRGAKRKAEMPAEATKQDADEKKPLETAVVEVEDIRRFLSLVESIVPPPSCSMNVKTKESTVDVGINDEKKKVEESESAAKRGGGKEKVIGKPKTPSPMTNGMVNARRGSEPNVSTISPLETFSPPEAIQRNQPSPARQKSALQQNLSQKTSLQHNRPRRQHPLLGYPLYYKNAHQIPPPVPLGALQIPIPIPPPPLQQQLPNPWATSPFPSMPSSSSSPSDSNFTSSTLSISEEFAGGTLPPSHQPGTTSAPLQPPVQHQVPVLEVTSSEQVHHHPASPSTGPQPSLIGTGEKREVLVATSESPSSTPPPPPPPSADVLKALHEPSSASTMSFSSIKKIDFVKEGGQKKKKGEDKNNNNKNNIFSNKYHPENRSVGGATKEREEEEDVDLRDFLTPTSTTPQPLAQKPTVSASSRRPTTIIPIEPSSFAFRDPRLLAAAARNNSGVSIPLSPPPLKRVRLTLTPASPTNSSSMGSWNNEISPASSSSSPYSPSHCSSTAAAPPSTETTVTNRRRSEDDAGDSHLHFTRPSETNIESENTNVKKTPQQLLSSLLKRASTPLLSMLSPMPAPPTLPLPLISTPSSRSPSSPSSNAFSSTKFVPVERHQDACAQFQKQIDDLLEQLTHKDTELARVKKTLQKRTEAAESAEKERKIESEKNALVMEELRAKCTELEKNASAMVANNKEMTLKLLRSADLDAELKDARAALERSEAKCSELVRVHHEELERVTGERDELSTELREARTHHEKRQKDLAAVGFELQRLQAEGEKLRSETKQLRATNAGLVKEKVFMKNAQDALKCRAEKLAEKLQRSREAKVEFETELDRACQLRETMEHARSEVEQREKCVLEERDALKVELETLQKRFNAETAQLSSERDAARINANNANNQVVELNEELEETRKLAVEELRAFQSRLDEELVVRQKVDEKLRRAREAIVAAEAARDAEHQLRERAERVRAEVEQREKCVGKERDALKAELELIQKRFVAETSRLNSERDAARTDAQNAQKQVTELEEALERTTKHSEEEIQTFQSRLDVERAERKKLDEKLRTAIAELEMLREAAKKAEVQRAEEEERQRAYATESSSSSRSTPADPRMVPVFKEDDPEYLRLQKELFEAQSKCADLALEKTGLEAIIVHLETKAAQHKCRYPKTAVKTPRTSSSLSSGGIQIPAEKGRRRIFRGIRAEAPVANVPGGNPVPGSPSTSNTGPPLPRVSLNGALMDPAVAIIPESINPELFNNSSTTTVTSHVPPPVQGDLHQSVSTSSPVETEPTRIIVTVKREIQEEPEEEVSDGSQLFNELMNNSSTTHLDPSLTGPSVLERSDSDTLPALSRIPSQFMQQHLQWQHQSRPESVATSYSTLSEGEQRIAAQRATFEATTAALRQKKLLLSGTSPISEEYYYTNSSNLVPHPQLNKYFTSPISTAVSAQHHQQQQQSTNGIGIVSALHQHQATSSGHHHHYHNSNDGVAAIVGGSSEQSMAGAGQLSPSGARELMKRRLNGDALQSPQSKCAKISSSSASFPLTSLEHYQSAQNHIQKQCHQQPVEAESSLAVSEMLDAAQRRIQGVGWTLANERWYETLSGDLRCGFDAFCSYLDQQQQLMGAQQTGHSQQLQNPQPLQQSLSEHNRQYQIPSTTQQQKVDDSRLSHPHQKQQPQSQLPSVVEVSHSSSSSACSSILPASSGKQQRVINSHKQQHQEQLLNAAHNHPQHASLSSYLHPFHWDFSTAEAVTTAQQHQKQQYGLPQLQSKKNYQRQQKQQLKQQRQQRISSTVAAVVVATADAPRQRQQPKFT